MQLPFDFGVADRVKAQREEVRSVLREGIAVLGLKRFVAECQAAGCNATESQISDAFAGRDRKYVRDEWCYLALQVFPEHLADKLAAAMLGPAFKTPQRAKPLTPEEERDALMRQIRKEYGPAADDVIRRALRR